MFLMLLIKNPPDATFALFVRHAIIIIIMDPQQEYIQRQQVLNSYRAFLSQKLEPELRKAHEERVKVEEKIADFRSLLTQIESIEKTTTTTTNTDEEEEPPQTSSSTALTQIESIEKTTTTTTNTDEEEEPPQTSSSTATVRIDLGSEILCDLAVENGTSNNNNSGGGGGEKLFVDIGLGFFCQLSFSEAKKLAKKRIEALTENELPLKREKEEKIVEHVEIVANGIKSLM